MTTRQAALYAAVLHIVGVVAVTVLLALKVLGAEEGVTLLAGLLGIGVGAGASALSSSTSTASSGTSTSGAGPSTTAHLAG